MWNKFKNILADFYYKNHTEKERFVNYEGTSFVDRLSAPTKIYPIAVGVLITAIAFLSQYVVEGTFWNILIGFLGAHVIAPFTLLWLVPSDLKNKFKWGMWKNPSYLLTSILKAD